MLGIFTIPSCDFLDSSGRFMLQDYLNKLSTIRQIKIIINFFFSDPYTTNRLRILPGLSVVCNCSIFSIYFSLIYPVPSNPFLFLIFPKSVLFVAQFLQPVAFS